MSGEVEVRLRLAVSLEGTTVQDFKRELRFTLEDAYGTGTVRELETVLDGEPTVSYEMVLQHLLAAHGEHLRTTETDPLSLGDFVTLNYVNPLYARAADHRPKRAIRFIEDESRGHH